MRDALVTRGVNVRPQKRRFGSCPPRGLATSGAGWIVPARSRGAKVLRKERERIDIGRATDEARSHMHRAQDAVAAAKRDGEDTKVLAKRARDARSEYLRLTGGLETRVIQVAQSSESNPVKAT